MMGTNTIVDVLISLLLFAVLFWAIDRVSSIIGIPATIVQILRVVLVVVFVIWLLKLIGLFAGLAVG